MGEKQLNPLSEASKVQFTNQIIKDLKALDWLLTHDQFENDIQRIGAEQEFCLIDYSLRPSMIAMQLLERLNDSHFTTELALFNLEVNLDPLAFSNNCFALMESDLISKLTKANKMAHSLESKIILTGILPTIRNSDIKLENITPLPRYKMLNDAMLESRASNFQFNISGLDELISSHDTVLFESCNTSFQVHFQVHPEHVVNTYNWAHVISGPILSAATNAPIFLGKRLWSETRIALFQQSADTRKSVSPLRQEQERVTFGSKWETKSPLEIFQDTVSRYKILLPLSKEEDAMQLIRDGKTPRLKALSLHNSTIYRWNRLCYGITENRPHLRIEVRYLPSGPTIIDEIANAALWTGLMNHIPANYQPIPQKMDFDQAKHNFMTAAKYGLQAQFNWFDNRLITAQDLLLKELIPIAREGLSKAEVAPQDIDRYMGILEERVKSGRTGSNWMLFSYNQLKKESSNYDASVALTDAIYHRQKKGNPVHTWEDVDFIEGGGWQNKYKTVEQVMSKDLITLNEDDLLDLARNIMLWSNVHHIPIENSKGELIGLLTSDRLLAEFGTLGEQELARKTVGSVMNRSVIQISPQTETIDAYNLMKENEIGCLPVIENEKLVGIITHNDFTNLIAHFFKQIKPKTLFDKKLEP